jgi:hypothetical protein
MVDTYQDATSDWKLFDRDNVPTSAKSHFSPC